MSSPLLHGTTSAGLAADTAERGWGGGSDDVGPLPLVTATKAGTSGTVPVRPFQQTSNPMVTEEQFCLRTQMASFRWGGLLYINT